MAQPPSTQLYNPEPKQAPGLTSLPATGGKEPSDFSFGIYHWLDAGYKKAVLRRGGFPACSGDPQSPSSLSRA